MAFPQLVAGGIGVITQPFGQTAWAMACRCEWTCPGYAPGAFHAGIDIASADRSQPVLLAIGYGTCVKIGRVLAGYSCSGLGPWAPCIRSGPVDIWYGHALKSLVEIGEPVWPGKPVAIMDSIGCSTGNHVHFEVLPAGSDPNGCNAIDPMRYLYAWPGLPPVPAPAPAPVSAGRGLAVPALLVGGALLLLAAGARAETSR